MKDGGVGCSGALWTPDILGGGGRGNSWREVVV